MSVSWPYRLTLPVLFRDLDAYGHVNNAIYLSYLEQARNDCYLRLLGRTDPLERGKGLDFVVARCEIDYLLPLHHGDSLMVVMRPLHAGASSFSFTYEGLRQDGALVLRARTVLVSYDWERQAKKPLPEGLAQALLEGVDSPAT